MTIRRFVLVPLLIWTAATLAVVAQTCGPSQNTLGDLAAVGVSVSHPDVNGIVTIQLSYQTAVGSGESIPPTVLALKVDGNPYVQLQVEGQAAGSCPDAEGWGNECVESGCTENAACDSGHCDCKKSPDKKYEKCKCITQKSGTVYIPARVGAVITMVLDYQGSFAEDDECNNVASATVD